MPNHLLIFYVCYRRRRTVSVSVYTIGRWFSIIGGDVEHTDAYIDSYDVFVNSIARVSTEE